MAFVPAANVAQVNLRMTLAGQQMENTLYFRPSTTPLTVGDMEALGDILLGWWASDLAPYVVDDLELREVYVTDLTTNTSPTVTRLPVAPPLVGGDADPPLPNNCALVVSFRTEKRGRSFRGRNYVAGIGEGRVLANRVDNPTSAGIRDAYAQLLVPQTLPGFEWVVVSRFENKQPRVSAEVTKINSVVLVDDFIDSQRRRLPGRGR